MQNGQDLWHLLLDCRDDALAGWIDPVEKLAVAGSWLDDQVEVNHKRGVCDTRQMHNKLELVRSFITLVCRVRH